jgi:3-hydroxyacyl-[acyl-carrier-protein] dehydratase
MEVAPLSPETVKGLLFDLSGIDLNQVARSRSDLERINPHRHEMALLDAIVWHSDDFRRGLARWDVTDDEFWVRGHFPSKALLPGVLQVEAGAQVASFLYNSRFPKPKLAAFMMIDECRFRTPVVPGDTFYILCNELKFSERRFTSHVQGVVGDKTTFEAKISGIAID